jgi:hypothetical protein
MGSGRWQVNGVKVTGAYRLNCAAELSDTRERDRKDTREDVMPPSGFRTLVALDSPYPERDGKQFRVSAGMLVSAEVNLGSRTVMAYLLSPVQKVTHEAGREM